MKSENWDIRRESASIVVFLVGISGRDFAKRATCHNCLYSQKQRSLERPIVDRGEQDP